MERRYFVETGIATDRLGDFLLAAKYDARVTTLKYVKDITQAELDWQPYEKWNTVGALLSHIIATENIFRICFAGKRELTADEKEMWMPALELGENVGKLKGRTPEYYMAELLSSHQKMKEVISGLTGEQLLERRFDFYDKVNGYDLAWALYHSAEDEVHHRGQISITRKLYKQMGG